MPHSPGPVLSSLVPIHDQGMPSAATLEEMQRRGCFLKGHEFKLKTGCPQQRALAWAMKEMQGVDTERGGWDVFQVENPEL